jgi:hypothetical protein
MTFERAGVLGMRLVILGARFVTLGRFATLGSFGSLGRLGREMDGSMSPLKDH